MDTHWQTLTVGTLLLQVLLALGALPLGELSNVVENLHPFNLPPGKIPVPPPPSVPWECGLPEEELDQLVKEFNAHRLEVAEKDQIANMHEIRFDFELSNNYTNGTGHCFDSVICEWIEDGSLKFGDQIIQNYPTLTGFAFCTFDGIKPKRIFLYFPAPPNNTNHVVSGPPGSQCPNGKAASGLCKAPWNTETTTLPPVPSTTQPAEGIDNGAKLAYSFGLILLVSLLVKKFY